jgi:itaconate CoA-transferase
VVPRFAAGTVTTTTRMDTHYLVTEYGAVNLMGKSTCERAMEIIKLAHPKFRDSLTAEARKMCLA